MTTSSLCTCKDDLLCGLGVWEWSPLDLYTCIEVNKMEKSDADDDVGGHKTFKTTDMTLVRTQDIANEHTA